MLVSSVGFDARHFLSNGVLLPATEEIAEQTGLALHRGPHRHYDQLVSEYLCQISKELTDCGATSRLDAYKRIADVQGMLRRALGQDASLMLNRNDPRYSNNPLTKLDYDALQLMQQGLLT